MVDLVLQLFFAAGELIEQGLSRTAVKELRCLIRRLRQDFREAADALSG